MTSQFIGFTNTVSYRMNPIIVKGKKSDGLIRNYSVHKKIFKRPPFVYVDLLRNPLNNNNNEEEDDRCYEIVSKKGQSRCNLVVR